MKTKKDLKEEYKQVKYPMGVYQIRNRDNGKVLISSNLDLNAIWHSQKLQLDMGIHANSELQNDWKTFGADNFYYEVLEEVPFVEGKEVDYQKEIKILEQVYLEQVQPFGEKGYNKKRD